MTKLLLRRLIYLLTFAFFIWLALATRHHKTWFTLLIVKYGGDVLWAGAFLFLLRAVFINASLLKLALCCYLLGVIDELSQLINTPWANEIRSTTLGRLMFGVGFLWSDLLCYVAGTLLAFLLILLIEKDIIKEKVTQPE
ncbi:DUF2809 domain-containing protein [Panacibacter sp. DH6]|uniref:DUF2809 domain-containing protein n=1 Tax=Panacibacter microcysteis TaxID=2793269 RepID=A0A931GW20_9BACT|nr:DUF2809 domain-containing protein [Panacibacter microcysteis]MBG9377080.1 DUF2809 domain-containing protein [Panacibacter microcysteis]